MTVLQAPRHNEFPLKFKSWRNGFLILCDLEPGELPHLGKDQSVGVCAGVAQQVDDHHEVRARVNDEMQLNVAVNK